jgi:hypothetical protein
MKRRDALKLGAGMAAGMALGTTGCALPGVRQEGDRLVPEDMDAFLKGWDGHLEGVGQARFVEDYAAGFLGGPLTPEQRGELEPSETLFRKMLHTMLLTQTFRDLSDEGQRHPEVQKRMLRHAQGVHDTVFAVSGSLESLDTAQRKALQEALLEKPDLAMGIAETLDAEAARGGITGRRRIQLRSMMTQASFRLSKADPGTVIDECVSKVKRASAPGRAEMLAAQTAAQAGGEAFFRAQAQADGQRLPGEPPAWRHEPGGGAINSGLWMMGIGAVTFGVSAIFVNAGSFPFVFGMTAGAVLFAIGLITLIVGAIIRLVKHKR